MQSEVTTSNVVYICPIVNIAVVPIKGKPFVPVSVVDEIHEKVPDVCEQAS